MGFKVAVAADAAGVDYKEAIKADLEADPRVDEVIDVGIAPGETTPYPR
ncbi:MAG: D-erythrulose-4-phosphate isomerase 1, partial [Propionibacterium sp.]|nr:D-erythrulose-4-phosphate isomerase 1 [Propionibacterium sp.]